MINTVNVGFKEETRVPTEVSKKCKPMNLQHHLCFILVTYPLIDQFREIKILIWEPLFIKKFLVLNKIANATVIGTSTVNTSTHWQP